MTRKTDFDATTAEVPVDFVPVELVHSVGTCFTHELSNSVDVLSNRVVVSVPPKRLVVPCNPDEERRRKQNLADNIGLPPTATGHEAE
jgi:hypothetical protein